MNNQTPVSSDLYDKEYYKDKCRGFNQFIEGNIHPSLKYALDLATLANSVILDVGCGRGELVYVCAKAGCSSYGIDYSAAAVGITQELVNKLPDNIKQNIHLAQMDAKELKYPDDYFDYLFALDIVEHLHPWELDLALKEMYRVLKPNGKLIIHSSPNKIAMLPAYWTMKFMGTKWGSQEYHVNEQTYWSMNKYLSKLEFDVKLWILKDNKFWFHCIEHRNSTLFNTVAKIYDFILDNPISEFLIKKSFLSKVFGNDIWGIATKRS